MAQTLVSTSASSLGLKLVSNPSSLTHSDSLKLSLPFEPLRSRKLKKLVTNVKNVSKSSIKAVHSGGFWVPESSSRQGIWSIRDDLQAPSSPYFPVYAGQGPPPMVQERFHSVVSQLFQHRIIRCGGAVEDGMANIIVAQLLYLDAVDPTKDIVMYINSPGGLVTAGMAIFDTMRHIRPDVSTVCAGLAASMGAFLLSAGTKGKRYSLPNSRIMIHQPLGGAQGGQTDIQANEMMFHKANLKVFSPDIDRVFFPITLTVPKLSKPLPSLRLSVGCFSSPSSDHHTSLLVETFHEHRSFKTLLNRLTRPDSCPRRLLQEDGDWTKDYFWAVVRFLRQASRAKEILTLFDTWKSIEQSRINELNYGKIINLLSEEGLLEEAMTSFKDMKSHGLALSLEVYNSVIHGFARKGNFEDALLYLNEMRDFNVAPESDTYDGLIEAYASRKMYDEIGICLRRMRSNGCPPDKITYNLLMREFSRGGLLKRMESTYHAMVSKGMQLQPPTLLAMIETYARFGILDKMEKFYIRALKTKTPLSDDLIRKLAEVYISNYMFSKLETLGVDLAKTFGGSDLLWCLRLLSHACLFSRKGMDSVIEEMEEKSVPWNVTVSNIICLTHLKMKDFTHLRSSLTQLGQTVNPDMVSVGILFDAIDMGFNDMGILETWKRKDFFYQAVEINTDPLVLAAFGKGFFLGNCEDAYSSLERPVRESKAWTYENLIELVLRLKGTKNIRK